MRPLMCVVSTAILLLLSGACQRTAPDARAGVFPSCPDLAVNQSRWSRASMVVMYWPQLTGCVPCELPALRSLSQASIDSPDIQLILVLPAGAANVAQQLDVAWHASVVRLDKSSYQQQLTLTPLPRVEAWGRGGKLLLLKTVAPNLIQAAGLGDEVRWAKARALAAKR